MTREEAINNLLSKIKLNAIVSIVLDYSILQPRNYSLQLLHTIFNVPTDINKDWFTALGVMCTHQKKRSGRILQKANILSGNPPMTETQKTELIDAIAAGAKLTKADAG